MPIGYRVPYEISLISLDSSSNQACNTVLHYRGGIDVTPPAYGTPVPGSALDVALTSFRNTWRAEMLTRMSSHYQVKEYRIKAVTGWSVQSTPRLVAGASNTTPIEITTVGDHGIETGDTVTIAGVLGNTNANGTTTVTVTGDATFLLTGTVGNGLYAGGGEWTYQTQQQRVTYGEQAVLVGSPTLDIGSVAGQALPVFATWSIFKKTNRAGRWWRGGTRMSPIPETFVNNGRFELAEHTLNQTAVDNLLAATLASGGLAGDGGVMNMVVFSRSRAFTQPDIFTDSEPICADVQGLISQRNTGSMTRRKPKLNEVLSLS